jgi:hypothetical protein
MISETLFNSVMKIRKYQKELKRGDCEQEIDKAVQVMDALRIALDMQRSKVLDEHQVKLLNDLRRAIAQLPTDEITKTMNALLTHGERWRGMSRN